MTMSELVESTGLGEMIEPMTVDSIDQRELAEQLVEQAKEQNIELVGPGGLLGQLTKNVLETALDAEMSEHLGYEKHDPAGRGSGNSRNGTRLKTVLTEIGPVEIEVPRDTDSTFEPQIVRKRQRRLTGVDEIVLSLTARGLTTGEIAAHFQEVYGAKQQGHGQPDHGEGDWGSRPYETRKDTLGDAMEACTERIRDSVPRKNQLTNQATSTVNRTLPALGTRSALPLRNMP
jgi:hypothetical protein